MASKIIVLDEKVANQIAAGEVIERPASIVKELVENSIDAGSTRIQVEIQDGGRGAIRILDNGEGISQEDVVKAFERHATSKIREASDLFSIRTLGFRGEALPSIAAVSRVTIQTRTADEPVGTLLKIEGGEIKDQREVGMAQGTDFLVEDLFFNTPARYKYLKTNTTELSQISDIFNSIAIAEPQIAMTLVHNGRPVNRTPGTGRLKDVIYSIYGREMVENLVEVEHEDNYVHVSGYVTRPTIYRSSRKHQSFYVNGRFVRSVQLSRAVGEAYANLLPASRHPIVFLFVKINPIHVDVNVHPAKFEVKFSRPEIVEEVVTSGIRKALMRENMLPVFRPMQKFQTRGEDAEAELTSLFDENMESSAEQPTRSVEDRDTPSGSYHGTVNEEMNPLRAIGNADINRNEPGRKNGAGIGNSISNASDNIGTNASTSTRKGNTISDGIRTANRADSGNATNFRNGVDSGRGTNIANDSDFGNETNGDNGSSNGTETFGPEEGADNDANTSPEIDSNKVSHNAEDVPYIQNQTSSASRVAERLAKMDYQRKNWDPLHRTFDEDRRSTGSSQSPNTNRQTKSTNHDERRGQSVEGDNHRQTDVEDGAPTPSPKPGAFIASLLPIGQIHQTYIIAQGRDGFYVIDQHVAHERILYEELMATFRTKGLPSQGLLIPLTLELTLKEVQIIQENETIFNQLGFEVENFGGNTVIIRAVPRRIDERPDRDLFLEIVDLLLEEKKAGDRSQLYNKLITTMSCKGAIKAGQRLEQGEMIKLLQELSKTENPRFCPHGRPILFHISEQDLLKAFQRI